MNTTEGLLGFAKNFRNEQGIYIFESQNQKSSSYEAAHLKLLQQAEDHHFWFQMRKQKICKLLQTMVPKTSSILEIGSGTGFIAKTMQDMGYPVIASDLYLEGLQLAKNRGVKNLCQFDLFSSPFKKTFDVVALFDVLEHFKNDSDAIIAIKNMLKPNGKIILSVPAHRWLWSQDDVLAGHTKRYTKKDLEKLFIMHGLRPLKVTYFFLSLVPFLSLRAILKRPSSQTTSQLSFQIHPWMNFFFKKMVQLEFSLEKILPNQFGGSLLAIAQLDSHS